MPTRSPFGDSASAWVFVIFAFVSLAAVHFKFAYEHSFPVPYWDESGFIPQVTGAQPVTLEWLWSPANEHRIVAVRLIYLFFARISGLDERFLNGVSVGILVATSGLLLLALRKVNGTLQYTDAIIPLALLGLGHHANTTWPNQIGFVIPPSVACLTAALLALHGRGDEGRYRWLAPAVLVTCLCGANGLPVGLSFTPLLLWSALLCWRAGKKRQGVFMLTCGLMAIVYSGLYFVGLPRVVFANGRPFVFAEGIAEGFKAWAICFGPAGAAIWPISAVMAIILIVAGMSVLARQVLTSPEHRFSAVGLALAIGGVAGLGFGIGLGRTVLGEGAGFAPRYALIMAPLPIATILAFDRFGTPQARAFMRMTLFAVFCMLYWPNAMQSIGDLEARVSDGRALEQQVKEGMPIRKLAADFGARWMFRPDIFADNMRMLATTRMGIYRRHDPPTASSELLAELSENTEVKGPSTSGQLFPMKNFGLPGSIGLIAHAPHRASIPIPGPVPIRSIHVGFGVLEGPTDGVEFRISLRRQDGSSIAVWSRILDPRHSAGDSGLQQIEIPLPEPAGPTERLVFETIPVKSPEGCWSYWTEVELHRRRQR